MFLYEPHASLALMMLANRMSASRTCSATGRARAALRQAAALVAAETPSEGSSHSRRTGVRSLRNL
jgi:hypothetical protein